MTDYRYQLLLVLLAAVGCASQSRRMQEIPADLPRLTVMTFNVNYGLAGDAETLSAITSQRDADVILLQETTQHWQTVLRNEMRADYPYAAFHHDHPAGGLAVLSKYPIENVQRLPAVDWFPAVKVTLRSNVGAIQILNVHLRPPVSDGGSVVYGYFTTSDNRQREIADFSTELDPDLPTLIVGDFNENERGRALQWLKENGYRSALPEFASRAHTWRWRTSIGTLRNRYDHICYDARWRPLRVEVRPLGRSDHLPIVGTFALAEDYRGSFRSER